MNALGYKKQEKCSNSSAITTITKYMNITQLIHTMWIDDSSILVFALVIQNVNQMTDSLKHLIEKLQFTPRPIHRSCTIPECQPCESAIRDKAKLNTIRLLTYILSPKITMEKNFYLCIERMQFHHLGVANQLRVTLNPSKRDG